MRGGGATTICTEPALPLECQGRRPLRQVSILAAAGYQAADLGVDGVEVDPHADGLALLHEAPSFLQWFVGTIADLAGRRGLPDPAPVSEAGGPPTPRAPVRLDGPAGGGLKSPPAPHRHAGVS